MVWLSAIFFLLFIFPIHISNYIYVNSVEGYASINVCLFRFIKIFNANTIKNKMNGFEVNGKEKTIDTDYAIKGTRRIFNKIYFHKIIQLADYGMKKDNNAYYLMAHWSATQLLYSIIDTKRCVKLKNYIILNDEHAEIRYYAKAVNIINVAVILKILLIILKEKIYELKNKA